MGFEPTTLRDLVGCSTTELLETRATGSWVQIPSGARIFSEFSKRLIYHVFVVSSLIYSLWRLVGCILICINVTA